MESSKYLFERILHKLSSKPEDDMIGFYSTIGEPALKVSVPEDSEASDSLQPNCPQVVDLQG